MRSYDASVRSASMNLFVMPTLMLKLVICDRSSLQVMKSITSGWSTRRMPMLAPRRVPPCFTASVDASYSFMKEMGPLATPVVERTIAPLPRRREKLNPVPPPLWWMSAMEPSVS